MSTETLTPNDVKELLEQLSTAIKLDQIYVDSLPRDRFPSAYDDGMWRDWRRDHQMLIGRLIASVHAMPPTTLERLTWIATAADPSIAGRTALEILGEIVSRCSAEDCETACDFFAWLIERVERQAGQTHRSAGARRAMSSWLPTTDPLRIERDPECGYGAAERNRSQL